MILNKLENKDPDSMTKADCEKWVKLLHKKKKVLSQERVDLEYERFWLSEFKVVKRKMLARKIKHRRKQIERVEEAISKGKLSCSSWGD